MKKIKSALFMVALCATLAMLTSCGNNKKTKYTYAPLWDNTISEKDTTGIVGHIFKGTDDDWTEYTYFSESGYYYNYYDDESEYSDKEIDAIFQKLAELDKSFQKKFYDKYGKIKDDDIDFDTEIEMYHDFTSFEDSLYALDIGENLTARKYFIDKTENIIVAPTIANSSFRELYSFRIEKNEPVVIEEHRSSESIYYLYK